MRGVLTVRITDQEHARLERLGRENGVSRSNYVRALLGCVNPTKSEMADRLPGLDFQNAGDDVGDD